MNKISILGVFFFFLISCGEEVESSEDPSNLSVSSEVNDLTVEVTATAANAVMYEFDFGDESDLVTNTNGIAAHSYAAIGVYEIVVKAIGANERFLSETEFVTIGDPDAIVNEGFSTPEQYDGWTRIWTDEFEGNELNASFWNYEIGTGSNGWGNNELQYYREQNTEVADGFLTIQALQQSFQGQSYTSSRLTTEDKFDFQYGRVDIRAKLPFGQGIWPALWMLGANFRDVGWPNCGEIDIMEMIGGSEERHATTHGTIHWDENGNFANTGGSTTLEEGILHDEFHVYSIIWDDTAIRWLLDDEQFHSVTTTSAVRSAFHEPFFFIFNVAVGGNWPGSPDATTTFPQKLIVDYIRVFQQN